MIRRSAAARRACGALGIAVPLALGLALPVLLLPPARAGAEEGAVEGVPESCPPELTEEADEQCARYWENHVNWFSWDYSRGPRQAPQHRHMPPPFFFALVNFGVFAWIMWRLAARPLKDYVRSRHATLRKDLDEARAIHREAEERLAGYNVRLAGLDGEIDALLEQVRGEAEAEKARIIAEAREHAARLEQDARVQIQVEIGRLREELKREAVDAAMAAAEEMLVARTTADDQARLAERFATELERPGAAHGLARGGAPVPAAPAVLRTP